jgi:hypothetical protein
MLALLFGLCVHFPRRSRAGRALTMGTIPC